MASNDVTERVIAYDDDGNPISVPVASTTTPGIAQFEPEDFAVTDEGVVSLLQKYGGIQYLGIPTPTSTSTCTWTLLEGSAAPLDEVRKGQLIMATQTVESNYGDVVTGDVFVIESVVGDVVTTSMTLITALRGPQGEKGDKGDKGEKGDTGARGVPGGYGTLSVGTVTTGEPGTDAAVEISGEAGSQIIDFTIPRGYVGPVGPQGPQGESGETFTIQYEVDYTSQLPDASEELLGVAYFVGTVEPRDVWVCVEDGTSGEIYWSNQGPLSGVQGEAGKDTLVVSGYEYDGKPVVNSVYSVYYTEESFSREPELADRFIIVWKDTDIGSIYLVTGVVTYIVSSASLVEFEVLSYTLTGCERPDTYEETLYASAWSDNTLSVTLTGLSTTDYVKVTPADGYSALYVNYGIEAVSVEDDTLTFTCETVPTEDIVVNIVVSTYDEVPIVSDTTTVRSLEDMTWAEIASISQAGKAPSIFHIGQEKKISLSTGEEVTAVIIGFNHDDLADGSGKAGITFSLKNCLKTTYQMNSTATNEGGWRLSEMRGRMSTFKGYLPTELQNVIRTVNKKTSAGSLSSDIDTTEDDLFLFSHVELYGTHYSEAEEERSFPGEGHQYEYYWGKTWLGTKPVTNQFGEVYTYPAEKIHLENGWKGLGDDATASNSYWFRSPRSIENYSFCYSYYVRATSNRATLSFGVCFGFCV